MILISTVKNKFILQDISNPIKKINTMKTLIFQFVLLTAFSFGAIAQEQEKSNKEKKGDKFVFRYAYDKAIKSYTKADELTLDGQRNLAESYRKMDQNILAAETYKTIVSRSEGVTNEDYYTYAMILKSTGNYAESNIWMDKFQQGDPSDLRAQSYAAHKSELNTLTTHNADNKVESLEFNSDAQEFGPNYYNSNIVYSSSQMHSSFVRRRNNSNGQPYLEMYSAESKDGQLNSPEEFNKKFNEKYHDGPASFSNNGTYMAYTTNNDHDRTKDKVVELQICFSNYVDEKWTKEEDFIFNNPAYSVGHPCLTEDGNTMYFVSDMPGGFGKADLYKTTKNSQGDWTKPTNLGNKVNTEGDELFPFVEEKNEILIFSSNGHFGLGGLDVFMVAMNGEEFGEVTNPGAPINTMHDDFSMILEEDLKKSYFASNRNGANDDIYSANFTKGISVGKKIEGIAMDKDGTPLPNTFVTLTDASGNIIDTVTTQTEGSYVFLVDTDKNYNLVGTKVGLLDGKNTANTYGEVYVIESNLTLLEKPVEEVVEEEVAVVPIITVDQGKKIILAPIYFDLNKYNIRPDAAVGLDKIVVAMNENPNMIVKVSAYTDCRDTEGYNQVLSDKRAKATLAYIKKRITNPDRISGAGFGETAIINGCEGEGTVVSTCSEDQHQVNRRSEFIIVAK